MKMETIICTPYTKDLPLYSYDFINAIGKRTLLVEVYDTQVAPADLSTMDAVKAAYSDLDDKPMKPAWYDHLKLSPTVCKTGRGSRFSQMAEEIVWQRFQQATMDDDTIALCDRYDSENRRAAHRTIQRGDDGEVNGS